MHKKDEYLRFQAKRTDKKENRDYNINYVSKGISRVDFSRVVAQREKDISYLTISNKVMKGTNNEVSVMLNSYPNQIVLFREVFSDGKWNRIILEQIEMPKEKKLVKLIK